MNFCEIKRKIYFFPKPCISEFSEIDIGNLVVQKKETVLEDCESFGVGKK